MGTLQNITVAGLVLDLGLTGHHGITTARNSSDHTQLDVTVTPPAWVLLGDGTLFTSELSNTTVQAPTTDGSYHLYIDTVARVTATVPAWVISATAPSVSALNVSNITVSGGVISAASDQAAGLRNLPVAGGLLGPINEFIHVVTTDTQALDAATYTGFHMDIAIDTTLSVTGATNGHLYTMALDGTSSGHTVTFGDGFAMATTTLSIGVFETAVLVFLGHDGNLNELSRTNPVS